MDAVWSPKLLFLLTLLIKRLAGLLATELVSIWLAAEAGGTRAGFLA